MPNSGPSVDLPRRQQKEVADKASNRRGQRALPPDLSRTKRPVTPPESGFFREEERFADLPSASLPNPRESRRGGLPPARQGRMSTPPTTGPDLPLADTVHVKVPEAVVESSIHQGIETPPAPQKKNAQSGKRSVATPRVPKAPDKQGKAGKNEKNEKHPVVVHKGTPREKTRPIQQNLSSRKKPHHYEQARMRQMTFFQYRRKQKRLQMFYARLRALGRVIFSVACLALLFWVTQLPFWSLQAEANTISGTLLLKPERLQAALQQWDGMPVYQVDPQDVETRLKDQFPMVGAAQVHRHLFPSRLSVEVTERMPWALVQHQAKVVKTLSAEMPPEAVSKPADPQGSPPSPAPKANASPKISVVPVALITDDYRQIELGSRLRTDHLAQSMPQLTPVVMAPSLQGNKALDRRFWRRMDRLQSQLHAFSGLHLNAIEVKTPHQIVLRFQEVMVLLGPLNHTTTTRLARLKSLLPTIQARQGDIAWIDLRWQNQVAIRKKKSEPWFDKAQSAPTSSGH